MLLRFVLAGSLLLLGACQHAPEPSIEPAPYPVAAPSAPGMGSMTFSVTASELASPNSYLGVSPTAVVLLKEGQGQRNARFCEGFRTLRTTGQLADETPYVAGAVPLRWLVTSETATAAQAQDCAFLLENYDYARATVLRNGLLASGAPAGKLSGAGPWIVEFMPGGSAIIVNGSTFNEGLLDNLAEGWLLAAGDQANALASTPQLIPEGCTPATTAQPQCSLTTILTNAGAEALRARFPEVDVVLDTGMLLACYLPPAYRPAYCGQAA